MEDPSSPLNQLKTVSDTTSAPLANQLASISFFSNFSAHELSQLAAHMQLYAVEQGEAVFVEDRYAGYLCVVLRGRLEIVKDSGKGHTQRLADVLAGTILGEMSFVDGEPHSATVIAVESTVLAALTRGSFDVIAAEQPALGLKLYGAIASTISRRLRITDNEYVNLLD